MNITGLGSANSGVFFTLPFSNGFTGYTNVQDYGIMTDGLGVNSPIYLSQVGLIVQPASSAAKTYLAENPTTQIFGVQGWTGTYINAISVLANGAVTINGFISASTIAATYQTIITNPVTGTGTSGYISFWSGSTSQSGDSNFIWDNTGKTLQLGIAAHTDYPAARAVFSKGVADGLDVENHNIGSVGLGLATNSATPNITTGWGVGFYGKGWTNGTARSAGIIGEGMVNASADTGASVGVRGYAQQTHAGGANISLYGSATNGATNYALYNAAGDFYSAASHSWIFGGTTSTTLSLYNGTHLGGSFLVHDTPTSSVFTWYGSIASGTITPNANITYNLGSAVALYSNIYGNNLLAEGGAGKGIKIGDAAHTSLIQTDGVNNGVGIGGAPSASYMLNVAGGAAFSSGVTFNSSITTTNGIIALGDSTTLYYGGLRVYTTTAPAMTFGQYNGGSSSSFTATSSIQQNGFLINFTVNQASGTAGFTDFLINRTQTAVGSGLQKLFDAGVGGGSFVSKYYIDNTGNTVQTGSAKTGAPSTGQAGAWKFGILVTATSVFDTTRYIQLDIGGTLYKVAVCS